LQTFVQKFKTQEGVARLHGGAASTVWVTGSERGSAATAGHITIIILEVTGSHFAKVVASGSLKIVTAC